MPCAATFSLAHDHVHARSMLCPDHHLHDQARSVPVPKLTWCRQSSQHAQHVRHYRHHYLVWQAGWSQLFWHRQQQLFKSWKCFLQTGPGCSKPALGNNAKHWKSRRFRPNLAPCYRLRPFSDELMLSCTFWGGNTENADVFGRLIITESSQSGTLPARIVGFQYRFLKGPLLARPSGIFRFLNTCA